MPFSLDAEAAQHLSIRLATEGVISFQQCRGHHDSCSIRLGCSKNIGHQRATSRHLNIWKWMCFGSNSFNSYFQIGCVLHWKKNILWALIFFHVFVIRASFIWFLRPKITGQKCEAENFCLVFAIGIFWKKAHFKIVFSCTKPIQRSSTSGSKIYTVKFCQILYSWNGLRQL